jgi:hypothetical protein
MRKRVTLHGPHPLPATGSQYQQMFAGRADQLQHVRALMTRFLAGFPAADDGVLLVSELAANACAHSASSRPGGTFTVRARRCGPSCCVLAEVEDQGSTWDGDLTRAQPPHGLFLLRALATDCGTRPGQHGWITWFTITTTQAPHP